MRRKRQIPLVAVGPIQGRARMRTCHRCHRLPLLLFLVILTMAVNAHTAAADEAADAAQVLSKLWGASIDAKYQFVRDGKPYKSRNVFVGDGKTYKMRRVFRDDDGTVDDTTEEAPFRFLEEDHAPIFAPLYPPSSVVGVKCLFGRDCIQRVALTFDPVYNPKAQPKTTWPIPISWSFGAVNASDADAVSRALRTLLKLNAASPFDPLAPQ